MDAARREPMNAAPSVRTVSAAATRSTSGGAELRRPQPTQARPAGSACSCCRQCVQRSNETKSSSSTGDGAEFEAVIALFYTQTRWAARCSSRATPPGRPGSTRERQDRLAGTWIHHRKLVASVARRDKHLHPEQRTARHEIHAGGLEKLVGPHHATAAPRRQEKELAIVV